MWMPRVIWRQSPTECSVYPYDHQLLINTRQSGESTLHFDLDKNPARWAWQKLPAWHPALAGKLSFFTGLKCGEGLFEMPTGMATAMTLVRWMNQGSSLSGRQSFTGQVSSRQAEHRFHYDTELYDVDGKLQQTILAQCVIFQQRNFGGWRRKMKQAIQAIDNMRPQDFGFAEPASAGLASKAECFVSPLHEGKNGLACYALLDARSGFRPQHPWHGGTGDHVNASHQLDAAWQMAHLIGRAQGWLTSNSLMINTGGEAKFLNYIELGTPFELRLKGWRPLDEGRQLSFALSQTGKACATISLSISQRFSP